MWQYMKNITWAMVGCGDVTEVKNGPGIYKAENSILKAVTNRTLEKAQSWVERHQHGMVYENIYEVLNDPEIDIVYIATTPDKHKEYAIKCAKAGKHCLIEKPLALNYEEGLEIKQAFEDAGKKAFVAFYRRSLNRFKKVKELIDSGEIGDIEGVNIIRCVKSVEDENAWRMNSEISGGNIFTETEIHVLDYMISIMGSIADFNYTTNIFQKKNSKFDSINMNFKFESGLIGSGQWLYNCNFEQDRFEIIGENGLIRFEFFNNQAPIYVINNEGCTEYSVQDSIHVGINMEQAIINELMNETDVLNGTEKFNENENFTGTVEEALKTLKIMDEVINA